MPLSKVFSETSPQLTLLSYMAQGFQLREFKEEVNSEISEYCVKRFGGKRIYKDPRALSVMLVLAMHLMNFQVNLQEFAKAIGYPPRDLDQKAQALGFRIRKDTITLPIPFKLPEPSLQRPKGK